jgi:hypothetical protein
MMKRSERVNPNQPRAALARDCLMRIELALDHLAALDYSGRWPWSRRLSLWCDTLILLSESSGEGAPCTRHRSR